MSSKNLPLRTGVGIVVLNSKNEVFVGKRKDNPFDKWQMPQGGVEPGETLLSAMKRELLEETGIMISTHKYKKMGTYILKNKMFFVIQLLKDIKLRKPYDTVEIGGLMWLPIKDVFKFSRLYNCNVTLKDTCKYISTIYEFHHKNANVRMVSC